MYCPESLVQFSDLRCQSKALRTVMRSGLFLFHAFRASDLAVFFGYAVQNSSKPSGAEGFFEVEFVIRDGDGDGDGDGELTFA